MRKWIFVLGVVVFLFCGCSGAENGTADSEVLQKSTGRMVADDVKNYWKSGILVEEGECKESGVVYEDVPVVFQDEVIEEMLRNMLQMPEGEIYISDLQKIHAIYWRHDSYWSNLQSPAGKLPHVSGCEVGPWETKQPESLVDLSYCYNLQQMEFGGINVPSLEPLFELPQLEVLQFEGATVTKEVIEQVGQLPVLKCLRIGEFDGTLWGTLTDGSFLLPLADQLTELHARSGCRFSPEVLSKLTKLEKLMIHFADDLSFFEHLTELKVLDMYRCNPTDWSALGYLENLESLDIAGCDKNIIEIDLEDVSRVKNVKYLTVTFTTINDNYSRAEIIEAMPSLEGLVTSLW